MREFEIVAVNGAEQFREVCFLIGMLGDNKTLGAACAVEFLAAEAAPAVTRRCAEREQRQQPARPAAGRGGAGAARGGGRPEGGRPGVGPPRGRAARGSRARGGRRAARGAGGGLVVSPGR